MRYLLGGLLVLLVGLSPGLAAPSPLLKAIRAGDLAWVKALLDRAPSLASARDPAYGSPPLMTAVSCHQLAIAQLLLERGADINAGNDFRQTPLHLAVQFGYVDLASWLLEHHADPNVRTKFGVTPLGLAVANKRDNIAALLRRYGGKQ